MFNIDTSNTVESMPTPLSAGTPGWFVQDSPWTVTTIDWMNALQAELLNILVAANIDPVKGSTNQILTSLQTLFVSSSTYYNLSVSAPTNPISLQIGFSLELDFESTTIVPLYIELPGTGFPVYRITLITTSQVDSPATRTRLIPPGTTVSSNTSGFGSNGASSLFTDSTTTSFPIGVDGITPSNMISQMIISDTFDRVFSITGMADIVFQSSSSADTSELTTIGELQFASSTGGKVIIERIG